MKKCAVAIMMCAAIVALSFFLIIAAPTMADEKAVPNVSSKQTDQARLNRIAGAIKANVSACFGTTKENSLKGIIKTVNGTAFNDLPKQMGLMGGGAVRYINGRAVIESGAFIYATFGKIFNFNMLALLSGSGNLPDGVIVAWGVSDGKNGFSSIDHIVVSKGLNVVLSDGSTYVFANEVHWNKKKSK